MLKQGNPLEEIGSVVESKFHEVFRSRTVEKEIRGIDYLYIVEFPDGQQKALCIPTMINELASYLEGY